MKMKDICLYDKNWWNKDNNNKEEINFYITYQKTYIDEKRIIKIIKECEDILSNEIKDNYNINIFYRYQPPLKAYING